MILIRDVMIIYAIGYIIKCLFIEKLKKNVLFIFLNNQIMCNVLINTKTF